MDKISHQILIEDKRKISITQVKEVVFFSDKEIKVNLITQSALSVIGDGLKITCFDENSGNFSAVGNIVGVKYKNQPQTFIKKVFS